MSSQDALIPDAARGMGVRIVGSKGSGKSRLAGRTIVFADVRKKIPTVVVDPTGGLIANVFDKIRRQPASVQRDLWRRVRYYDLAGCADTAGAMRVAPFPLLYPARSPHEAAQRFANVIRRADPDLRSAPIMGLAPLKKIAGDLGQVLYALGWQYSEAEELLWNARRHERRIRDAQAREPSIARSAAFLLEEFPNLPKREQEMQATAFLSRIHDYSRDALTRAIYCAATPAFAWDEVVAGDLLVLLDVSRVPDEGRQFAILWVYQSFVEWVRRVRGTGRHKPLSFVIDELTFMLGAPDDRRDPLAHDLNQLINVIARNASLWLTLMHQEVSQLSPAVAATLMTVGTQIYGSTTDPLTAQTVARRFFPYDPYREKRAENVWGSDMGYHYVIDHRTVDFSVAEQLELNSRQLLELPAFTFLVGIAPREGAMPTRLTPFSIRDLDAGQWPDDGVTSATRAALMERDGLLLDTVLAQIAGRLTQQQSGSAVAANATETAAAPVVVLAEADAPARGTEAMSLPTARAAAEDTDVSPTASGENTRDAIAPTPRSAAERPTPRRTPRSF